MGYVFLLALCLLVAPREFAILLLWVMLGTMLGVNKSQFFDISDVCESRGDEVDAVTITEEQKILNKCAQSYCRQMYGCGDSLFHSRLRQWVGGGTIALAVSAFVALLLPVSSPIPPAQGLLAVATVGIFVLTESFVWRRRLLARNLRTKSYQETRQLLAQRTTASVGGPVEFLERVKTAYGEIPQLSAPFAAPYWGYVLVYVLWALLGSAWALMLVAHGVWPPSAWAQLHIAPHGPTVLWLTLLDALLAVYFGTIACLSTSHWGAIQVGKRYYPLQIFCRDLGRVEKKKRVEATGLG